MKFKYYWKEACMILSCYVGLIFFCSFCKKKKNPFHVFWAYSLPLPSFSKIKTSPVVIQICGFLAKGSQSTKATLLL